MFGLDGVDHAIFDATLQFLQDVKAPMAFMFILAPRVGLEIRRQLQAEGRIRRSALPGVDPADFH